MITIISSYLLIILIILIVQHRLTKKSGITGAFAGFSFGMLMYYGLAPLLIWLFRDEYLSFSEYGYDHLCFWFFDREVPDYLIADLKVLLGYLALCLGYLFSLHIKSKLPVKTSSYYDPDLLVNKRVRRWAVQLFVVTSIALIIYMLSFETGFIGFLNIGSNLRGFDTSITVYTSSIFGYFVIIASLLPGSSILLYYQLIKDKKVTNIILFVFSFILSGIYYLHKSGKTQLIIYIIPFIHRFVARRTKYPWFVIIAASLLFIPTIGLLDNLFNYFEYGSWGTVNYSYAKYIRQFSHPSYLVLNSADMVAQYGLSFFLPFVTDIVSCFPGIDFNTTYVNTSQFILGAERSMISGIPNDVITYGYLQLGVAGIFIYMMLLGFLSGWIDKALKKIQDKTAQELFSVLIASQMFTIVPSADLKPIILGRAVIIIYIVIIIVLGKRGHQAPGQLITP